MNGPDFVGIGYPKCGTTFLYNTLTDHPQVENNKKERHYFSDVFENFDSTDYEDYRLKFQKKNSSNIVGEYSPGVLYYPTNIQFLSSAAPDAKYVVMLRNPIDRCFSHYKQLHNARIDIVNPDNVREFDRLSVYPEIIYSGLFTFGIEKALKYLDQEQIIILQYEKLIRDFNDEFKKLCDFLGIREEVPGDVNIRQPDQYEQYNYFRPTLKRFYEEMVEKLFNEYQQINEWSVLNKNLWEEFND